MPDWTGILGSNLYETIGADGANTRGTASTSGAANTKGAYVQLVASSAFEATGITLLVTSITSSDDYLIDVAVGAAASEQNILENVAHFGRLDDSNKYFFPLSIPAGSRIAVRHQQNSAAQVAYIMAILHSQPFLPHAPLERCTTYGANTGDSGGVGIDPGAVVNTKGAYSQIVAATTNNIRALVLSLANQDNNVQTVAQFFLDVAVGAGGSEQNIIVDWLFTISNQEVAHPNSFTFPVNIPAGSRLAARAQCTINDATDRLFDVVLHGLD